MKRTGRDLKATRLETWAMPGVPDVVLCDESGKVHFIELKATAGNAVDLRPHQVAWLTNHGHASVWVMVKKRPTKNAPEQLFVYRGSGAVDLRMEGLNGSVEPAYHEESASGPARGRPKESFAGGFDWDAIFSVICPQSPSGGS